VASAAEERRGEGLRRAVAASLMIMVFHKESEGNAMSNFTIDHGTVDGQTIARWTQDWWTWALNLPIKDSAPGASNPFQDPSGGSAGAGQSGPVFFLQSNTSQDNVYVPSGMHHFLVPLVNFIDSAPEVFPPHHDPNVIGGPNSIHSTEAHNISSFDHSVTSLFATVDGVAVPDLFSHLVDSSFFDPGIAQPNTLATDLFGVAPPGWLGKSMAPAMSGGYWLMLDLPSGTHTLNFGGMTNGATLEGGIKTPPIMNNVTDIIHVG
jgi:hypothetical protein